MNLGHTLTPLLIVLLAACTSAGHVQPMSEDSPELDPNHEETIKLIQQSDAYHNELKRKGLLYRDRETNDYLTENHQSPIDWLQVA